MSKKDLIVFMCPGLGYINRGYETHMRELFDLLKDEKDFDIVLLKRNGRVEADEKNIFSLKRNWKITYFLEKLTGIKATNLEQLSFFLISIVPLLKLKPKTIYVADFLLSKLLMKFKSRFGLDFKIIFRNGNNYLPPYHNADFIQQMLKREVNEINSESIILKRQFVVPHGFNTDVFRRKKSKYELRQELNLPIDKKIILSVGQVDKSIKRMDYLISEVSNASYDFYLLIIGQNCKETPEINKFASDLIGKKNYSILQVDYSFIPKYYQLSDIFVTTSLNEGFGRMYIEAALSNLPIITHDYEVARGILGSYPIYGNLNVEGNLTIILNEFISTDFKIDNNSQNNFINIYDWKVVKKKYIEMFNEVLGAK